MTFLSGPGTCYVDNPDARRRFQRRFHHLLVDEFQDTDPIQAEIAFFLAGDPDDLAGGMSKDWEAIVLTPGKLFMVGDPKQSIYRFRRADIVTMAHVRHPPGAREHAVAAELPVAAEHHLLGEPRFWSVDAERGRQRVAGRVPGPRRHTRRVEGGGRMRRRPRSTT